MNQVPIYNECGSCNMKFDTAAQLANHVKKFCSNSEYNDLDKLNKKYIELKGGNGSLNQNLGYQDQQMLQNIGSMSVSQAKGILKTQDPQFKQLERVAQKKREEELEEQLIKYKQDRLAFRAQIKGDDEALSSLANQYESKKDYEHQQKVEKDQIQSALNDSRLNPYQRQSLEQLKYQRDNLTQKETRFMDDVGGQMRGNTPNMMGQRNYQDLAIQEKSDKLKQLRQQQEELNNERLKIMSNVDRNKANDYRSQPKSQLGKAGASLVGFNIPDPQHQPENYRPASMHNNNNNQGIQYQPYNGQPNQMRTQSRDQILNQEKQKDWPQHFQKMLNDLDKIRADYKRADGQDPKFLQNLDNLEKFYRNTRVKTGQQINNSFEQSISPATHLQNNQQFNKNYNQSNNQVDIQMQNQMTTMVNQLQQQVQSLQKESQASRMLFQQEQEAMRLRQELEALQRGQGGSNMKLNPQMPMIDPFAQGQSNAVMFGKNGAPIIPSNQNNFTLSQINSKIHGFSDHGENPFSIFTPNQEFLLQNEVRTVDLDDEERLLANLSKEEVDQLRILSRIPVGTELYRQFTQDNSLQLYYKYLD